MSRRSVTIISSGAEETRELGRRLGAAMPAGTVIAAGGDLGAGKTVLAAGIAAGLGVADVVTSPTYIFFNDYPSAPGRPDFCHIDAYRLEGLSAADIDLIGLDDCFARDKAAFCEWPQFILDRLPREAVELQISRGADDQQRCLTFSYDDEKQGWLDAVLGH